MLKTSWFPRLESWAMVPSIFSRYKFLCPWNRQFFMGGNFHAPECPCIFRLSRAERLHSACLYHGWHNNWIKYISNIYIHLTCTLRSICFCAPCSPWTRPCVRFFAPALRFDSSCAPEISSKTAQFSSLAGYPVWKTCLSLLMCSCKRKLGLSC